MGAGITSADDPTINRQEKTRQHSDASNLNRGLQRQNEISGPLPGLEDEFGSLWGRGMGAMGAVQGNPFMGRMVTGASPLERNAIARGQQILGSGRIGQGSGEYLDHLTGTIRGDYLRPESNPFLAGAINLAQRSTMENFNNNVLPSISDASIAQGAYGGARQDIQQNLAAQDAQRGMGDIAQTMAFNNYNSERARQLGAGAMLGGAYDLAMAPVTTGMSLGTADRQLNDLETQDTYARFQEGNAAQFRGLPELAQLLTAGNFGAQRGVNRTVARGQSSTDARGVGSGFTENPNADSGFQNFLETALGIGSTAATLGGANGFRWW